MKIKSLIYKIALISTLLLCICLLCSCGDESETALEFTSNGDGTCYVSGIGDCVVENLVIPSKSPKGDTVVAIGDRAFFDCFTLKSVTIPDTVTKIGDNAFRGCIYLTEIDIPKSVKTIGKTILADCKALNKITVDDKNANYSGTGNCLIDIKAKTVIAGCNSSTIPFNGSVTAIADYAFFDLDSLKTVRLDTITSIGDHAFESCGALSSVTNIDLIESIGDYAFAACGNLSNFNLQNNESLRSIGKYAFHACDAIRKFRFPTTLTYVGDGAFWSCNKLDEAITKDISAWAQIEFGSSSATPLNYAKLIVGNNAVTEIVISEGAQRIGSFAFYGCEEITAVTLPDSVKSIGDYAFSDCAGMTSIEIGKGVKSIGEYAFRNCSSLEKLELPAALSSIGEYAFFSCGRLGSISVDANNQSFRSTSDCLINIKDKTLIRGCGKSVIPSDGSVVAIDNYAFNGCGGMSELTIPASIKAIGHYAFEGCSSLNNVTFEGEEEWTVYNDTEDANQIIPTASDLVSTYIKYYWVRK